MGIDRFREKYNADLANNFGNLVSRVCKLAEGLELTGETISIDEHFQKLMDELKFDEAIGWVFEKYIDKSNNLLNSVSPWKLEPTDAKRIETLAECATNLKKAAYYLKPIMPTATKKIENCFEGKVKPIGEVLFARIK